MPVLLRHVTTPELILAGFILVCLLPALLAEIKPRKRPGDETGQEPAPDKTSVQLMACPAVTTHSSGY